MCRGICFSVSWGMRGFQCMYRLNGISVNGAMNSSLPSIRHLPGQCVSSYITVCRTLCLSVWSEFHDAFSKNLHPIRGLAAGSEFVLWEPASTCLVGIWECLQGLAFCSSGPSLVAGGFNEIWHPLDSRGQALPSIPLRTGSQENCLLPWVGWED